MNESGIKFAAMMSGPEPTIQGARLAVPQCANNGPMEPSLIDAVRLQSEMLAQLREQFEQVAQEFHKRLTMLEQKVG